MVFLYFSLSSVRSCSRPDGNWWYEDVGAESTAACCWSWAGQTQTQREDSLCQVCFYFKSTPNPFPFCFKLGHILKRQVSHVFFLLPLQEWHFSKRVGWTFQTSKSWWDQHRWWGWRGWWPRTWWLVTDNKVGILCLFLFWKMHVLIILSFCSWQRCSWSRRVYPQLSLEALKMTKRWTCFILLIFIKHLRFLVCINVLMGPQAAFVPFMCSLFGFL